MSLGRQIAATSAGSEVAGWPEVVLVPGMAVSRYLWPTRDLLASDTRVHLLELPGTGRAPDLPRPLSVGLPEDAEAVRWWVSKSVAGPVLLVGHSYGTQVVARVASAVPDRLVGIILASPTIDPAFRSVARLLVRYVKDSRGEPEELRGFQIPEQRRAGVRRMLAMTWSMLRDDPEYWLRTVDVALTVVRGDRDALCSPGWARRLADRPGGELVEIPDAPHAFPFAQPHALVAAVRAMLGRVSQ